MKEADVAIVFYKEETLMHKKLAPISKDDVKVSFGRNDLIVYTSQQEIEADLKTRTWSETNLLLMSSGNFGGMNVDVFGAEIASKGQTS